MERVLLCRRLTLALMAAALTAPPLVAAPRGPAPQAGTPPSASVTRPGGAVALSLRRSNDSVELVIEGTGAGPVLQQSRDGQAWQGQLRITNPGALRLGPQRMTLPEAGLQSVSLHGSGSDYQIEVVPMPGAPLSRPVVSADGRNLIISFAAPPQASSQMNRFNLREPGMVPQANYAPPLQPRAVAPPLGDMAVGTMTLRSQSFVNAAGPNITLTLRNAPAKDALMAVAQMGGYGFVYVDDAKDIKGSGPVSGSGAPVTLSFRNESYERALNSVLLASGLQGKREGQIILAGPSVLGKGFGAQVSKIYRLNQASSGSAADYLASLGATITKVNVITNSVTQGSSQASQVAGGSTSQQTTTQNITATETYGGGLGPLRGLIGTTDSRLQTVTLIGAPALVAVAESYLRQIDLRQRQVALSVKILDVSLSNNTDLQNSFAFRSGSSFILSDNGQLTAVFGDLLPSGQPSSGVSYPENRLLDQVKAVVTSASTKVLASPTLILSENADKIEGGAEVALSAGANASATAASIGRPYGNEAFVTVGDQVITGFTTQDSATGAPPVCTPVFSNAGLSFGARVSKIDDNGFVTFSLSPEISAVVGQPQPVPNCGNLNTINRRRLDTGRLRVRDGQTLVLTGVISDVVRAQVVKWPILGDIPLVGQFFRSSGTARSKSELVILVTPKIVDDTNGGGGGYGYAPDSAEARRMIYGSM